MLHIINYYILSLVLNSEINYKLNLNNERHLLE
ncbi:Uncharacterised protein [Salmonella bongori]|nr:Uncharacterised protein [Salmonella bongori]